MDAFLILMDLLNISFNTVITIRKNNNIIKIQNNPLNFFKVELFEVF